jgi:P-type conjugative transfer protein TrbL
MPIDPGAVTLVQTAFLQHINSAFLIVTGYGLRLLYLLVTLEVVVFGLMWALRQDLGWGELVIKVLQIGLIFFLLQNSTWIFSVIIKSFAEIGGVVANVKDLAKIIFNPAQIWHYGYDFSLSLLRAAALGSSIGLVLIEVFLGLGILLTFGLLGIQIVIQVVGFYLVALMALIFLPFGAFSPTGDLFGKALQNVFKAGIRVMVLIVVIGISILVFENFGAIDFGEGSELSYNINQPLALFFTALLFLCLAWRLPILVADSFGKIRMQNKDRGGETFTHTLFQNEGASNLATSGVNNLDSLHAGATFDSRDTNLSAASAAADVTVNANVTTSGGTAANFSPLKMRESGLTGRTDLAAFEKVGGEQSISIATLKKLQKTITNLLQKSQSK